MVAVGNILEPDALLLSRGQQVAASVSQLDMV